MGKVKASPDMLERIKKTKHMGGVQPKVVHKIPGVTTMPDKKADKEFKKKLQAHKMVNKKPD